VPGANQPTYDAVGRLTEARSTPSGGSCTTHSYAYDADSNRLQSATHCYYATGITATGDRGGRRLNTTVLTIGAPGPRAEKLIACLRARVDPTQLRVLRPHVGFVQVADLEGRSDRVLQQLITAQLASCDPRWHDLVTFSKVPGSGARLEGRSPDGA
jgi:YD repeat-containing protein